MGIQQSASLWCLVFILASGATACTSTSPESSAPAVDSVQVSPAGSGAVGSRSGLPAAEPLAGRGDGARIVERFPNGFNLIRYSGVDAKEFGTGEPEDVVVLFDTDSHPVYALTPN